MYTQKILMKDFNSKRNHKFNKNSSNKCDLNSIKNISTFTKLNKM